MADGFGMVASRFERDLYNAHPKGVAPIWDHAEGLTVAIKFKGAVTRWPERTRCFGCRKSLPSNPVLEVFCGYKCAKLPAPTENVEVAPRPCKRAARGNEAGDWVFKQRFNTPEQAAPFLRAGQNVYRCQGCFFLHIGNSSIAPMHASPGSVPSTETGDLVQDMIAAVLTVRGEAPTERAKAAAGRDVRAALDVLRGRITTRQATAIGLPKAPKKASVRR